MESSIYILMVGIDSYKKVPRLKGCVNDIKKVENYLQLLCDYQVVFITLFDEQATKEAIVGAFHQITQKANANDTVLFYFAGHGTQEIADPVWKEVNGRLECIVCYDTNPDNSGEFLLANKELRYLIFKLAQTRCHIVTIFDCCNSGNNTRNGAFIQSNFSEKEILERRVVFAFPIRKWTDFIFHGSINYPEAVAVNMDELLPQGTHVQIFACESDESAVEVNGEGVFTNALIKVLENAGGNITYQSLKGRIRQFLRFVYKQQPGIFSVGATEEENQGLLHTGFLNKKIEEDQGQLFEAVYNKKNGWLLNAGAIHGVTMNSKISLLDPVLKKEMFITSIRKIFIDHSMLEGDAILMVPTEYAVYKVIVDGLRSCELKLHVINHDGKPAGLEWLAASLLKNGIGNFVLTDEEGEADYTLQVNADKLYLTNPGDPFRPLFRPIEPARELNADKNVGEQQAGNQLLEHLNQISRWNFIKLLQSARPDHLLQAPVQIAIMQVLPDGREEPVLITNKTAKIAFYQLNGNYKNILRIRLTNQTPQKIFVAAAYLSYNFHATVDVLERRVELLDAGESVSLKVRSGITASAIKYTDAIRLSLPDVVQEYNWPHYTETIKIIICEEAFNPEAFNLPAVPSPYTLADNGRRKDGYRTFNFEEEPPLDFPGWLTQTVNLHYENPFFNQVTPEKVNLMLANDKMAFFARGLYDLPPIGRVTG